MSLQSFFVPVAQAAPLQMGVPRDTPEHTSHVLAQQSQDDDTVQVLTNVWPRGQSEWPQLS